MSTFPALDDFFADLDHFAHADLIRGAAPIWSVLGRIDSYLDDYFAALRLAGIMADPPEGLRLEPRRDADGKWLLTAERCVRLETTIVLLDQRMALGAGALIEPGVVIKEGCIVGAGCELRQGAYLRGNVILGDEAVVGHVTEVKNSIFMQHAEAGHFAYVGDSLLGAHVNLGAGTKLANLPLRTAEQKESGWLAPIRLTLDGEEHDTGLVKLGAILGDQVEIGCNTVTAPGCLVGRECWIYPTLTVKKGYYPPRHIIKTKAGELIAEPMRAKP